MISYDEYIKKKNSVFIIVGKVSAEKKFSTVEVYNTRE